MIDAYSLLLIFHTIAKIAFCKGRQPYCETHTIYTENVSYSPAAAVSFHRVSVGIDNIIANWLLAPVTNIHGPG